MLLGRGLASLYDVLALLLLGLEVLFERQAKPGHDRPHDGMADADLVRLRQPGRTSFSVAFGHALVRASSTSAWSAGRKGMWPRCGPCLASPRSRSWARTFET